MSAFGHHISRGDATTGLVVTVCVGLAVAIVGFGVSALVLAGAIFCAAMMGMMVWMMGSMVLGRLRKR